MTSPNQVATLGSLALALMAATVALSAPHPVNGSTNPRFAAPLGSEAQCRLYNGLPVGWGNERYAGMAHIPAGSFVLGSYQGYADERPDGRRRTTVTSFWMDQTEVTVAQFQAFVLATGYVTAAEQQGGAVVYHTPSEAELARRPNAWWTWVKGANWRHPTGPGSDTAGKKSSPVTLVTQADALAYAHWLGRDLPTEAEWEYAAKAGREDKELDTAPVEGNQPAANYWQGTFPLYNTKADGHEGLAPVGCYSANGYRLFDMIGNAWEWTKDVYTGSHQSHANGDTATAAAHAPSQPMVIKGGSFLCSPDYCVRYRAAAREAQERDLPTTHIGFRTVVRDNAPTLR